LKGLGYRSNDGVKDLYNENYKPLKKEIREVGKISDVHGLAESIL
jgi:hypothetical protein